MYKNCNSLSWRINVFPFFQIHLFYYELSLIITFLKHLPEYSLKHIGSIHYIENTVKILS